LRSAWRAVAVAILICAGIIIVVRACVGPFHVGPIAVNSPLNVEGAFALVWVALVMWRTGSQGVKESGSQGGGRAGLLWGAAVAVIVVAVFWRSLWFPMLSDDYILVTQATHASGSIWKPFVEAGGDGSYRPVGYALLLASGKLANVDAFRWHAISLAVHAANSVLVYAAARYALKRSDVAALCAVLFALHGTRPEAVVWTAGRFDVFAGFFALAGLLLFLHYYATGKLVYAVASGLMVAAAIMSKESAYAFPALALAFLAAGRGSKPWRYKRLLTTLIVPVLLLAYRFMLFQGPGGYIDPLTGKAQILSVRFLPSLKALFPRFWAAMVFPIDWAQSPGFWLAVAVVIMIVCLVGLFVARTSLDRKTVLILVGCTIAAVLPAFHLLSIGPDLLGSRILYLPAVAFALLLAVLISSANRARMLGAGVVVFYIAVLSHNLSIWGRVGDLADRTCVAAAPRLTNAPSAAILGIPVAIDGVPFFANGFAECVGLHTPTPPATWTITHVEGAGPQLTPSRVLVWDGRSNTLR
jgi:hypothetical protein